MRTVEFYDGLSSQLNGALQARGDFFDTIRVQLSTYEPVKVS